MRAIQFSLRMQWAEIDFREYKFLRRCYCSVLCRRQSINQSKIGFIVAQVVRIIAYYHKSKCKDMRQKWYLPDTKALNGKKKYCWLCPPPGGMSAIRSSRTWWSLYTFPSMGMIALSHTIGSPLNSVVEKAFFTTWADGFSLTSAPAVNPKNGKVHLKMIKVLVWMQQILLDKFILS